MATFSMYFKDVLDADPSIELDVLTKYPLFDEGYRDWLNQQIKDQFWNREIGQETISMFKLALKRKLNQIMPLYNQHYLASAIKIDPLQTVNVKTVMQGSANTLSQGKSITAGDTEQTATGDTVSTGTTTGESNSESASTSTSRAIATDYPQTGQTDNGRYASSGQESESNANSTARGTEESKQEDATTSSNTAKGRQNALSEDEATAEQQENRDSETTGFSGQHSAMLIAAFRETLVNVDMMVLDELETLFMLIWDNGDEFTQRGYYGFGY